ncbi:tRNA (adenosine(37)-N6)-threonylcarbamoyltransferase complex ATPase subunit type 1 TsaE [Pelagibacteraceae bacterium]|jgi:tRNA threonylcarbamoyl adenosine modification protein YjeE|nr:tRNA (adenosine(37)-N6)-threonylcarbamoyltransferase complex ATPase subunit type 1 TsaE [Pelagibacteraceae bacterium]|tara:strand:+ start:848 stop:1303 length:456 start_codon:yes stop_codon:yes gene_type:complete
MIIKSLEHLNLLSIKVAKNLSRFDNVFLFGEIGTGKTTFTRYLINYLQEKEKINLTDVLSPTFNLLYEYDFKKFKLMHYDLYRLKNTKEIQQLGIFDEMSEKVNIIEWPELITDNIVHKIELKFNYVKNENERNIEVSGCGKWKDYKIDEL